MRGAARLIAKIAILSGARPRATYLTGRYPATTDVVGGYRPPTRVTGKVCAVASMTRGLKLA
jgi:hypothetical protein